jgi:hypothetical protein
MSIIFDTTKIVMPIATTVFIHASRHSGLFLINLTAILESRMAAYVKTIAKRKLKKIMIFSSYCKSHKALSIAPPQLLHRNTYRKCELRNARLFQIEDP